MPEEEAQVTPEETAEEGSTKKKKKNSIWKKTYTVNMQHVLFFLVYTFILVFINVGCAITSYVHQARQKDPALKSVYSERLQRKITGEEYQDLVLFVYCETNGVRNYDRELYLLDVVLTRVQTPGYPNTIKDVLFSPNEFGTLVRYNEDGTGGGFLFNGTKITFNQIPKENATQLKEVVTLALKGEGQRNNLY